MKTGNIGPSRRSRPNKALLILDSRDIWAISTRETRRIEPGDRRITSRLVTFGPKRVATRETVDGNKIRVTESLGKNSPFRDTGRSSGIIEVGIQCWTIIHGTAET